MLAVDRSIGIIATLKWLERVLSPRDDRALDLKEVLHRDEAMCLPCPQKFLSLSYCAGR